MDVLRAERVDRQGGHDGGIDASGQAQDGLLLACRFKIVADLADQLVVYGGDVEMRFEDHGLGLAADEHVADRFVVIDAVDHVGEHVGH